MFENGPIVQVCLYTWAGGLVEGWWWFVLVAVVATEMAITGVDKGGWMVGWRMGWRMGWGWASRTHTTLCNLCKCLPLRTGPLIHHAMEGV